MESSMILLAGFLYLSLKLLLYIFNAIHYTGMLFTHTYFPKPYQFLTWQMAKQKIAKFKDGRIVELKVN